jgi:hypothetical protein
MSKKKPETVKEEWIFTLRVRNPRAQTVSIERAYIGRALQLAQQEVRSSGSNKLNGQILEGYGVVLGEWEHTPATDAA